MRIKLICKAFLCLALICEMTNASQKYLTDGNGDDRQLAHVTSGITSLNMGQTSGRDSKNIRGPVADFTNASQTKMTLVRSTEDNQNFQFEGVLRYLGDDVYGLPHFKEYIEACVAQYKPGMKLSAPTEIKITVEDDIYLRNLGKFIFDNFFLHLFYQDKNTTIRPPKFIKMLESNERALKNFQYNENILLYGLMYYFDQPQAEPVHIEAKYNNYNNFKFEFTPYTTKELGTKINFLFDSGVNPFNSQVTLDSLSKDTLLNPLHFLAPYPSIYTPASFKFSFFKLEEATFRMNVVMSTKENDHAQTYTPQKITNITVRIKK